MDLFRRMINGRIRGNPKVQLKDTVVERSPMPDPRHDADDWNSDHEYIEEVVHSHRRTAAELPNTRWKGRRFVGGPPEEPCNHQSEIDQANADVDVDPEWPRLPRNLVDQEPKGAEKEDQSGDRSMERQSASAVTCGRRCYALIDNISHSQRALASQLSGLLSV